MNHSTDSLYKKANLLALLTIFYNIVEGSVSVWFGAADKTLSLLSWSNINCNWGGALLNTRKEVLEKVVPKVSPLIEKFVTALIGF